MGERKKKAAKSSENKNKKNNYSFQSTKKSTTNQQQKSTKKISTKKETKCQQQNQNININQNELYNFTTLFERILQHLIKHNKELVLKLLTTALENIAQKTEEQEDGVEDSAASSYDKLVAAGLSQKETESDDESLTLKQPIGSRTDILWELSKNFPRKWRTVGRKLGLEDSDLETLQIDYAKEGHNETVYQMLLKCKQENGGKFTYRVLGEALIAAGRRDLQEQLYEQAMKQHENSHTYTPRAAIHPEENEDTLDCDRKKNKKMVLNYGNGNNNISNNMSRKYVSNENQCKHSKLYTKKRCQRQKRKGKNKASPHQKGKAQNHANKQNDNKLPVIDLQTDSEKHGTHEKNGTSPPLAVIHHEEKEDMLDHDRNEYMKTILKNGNGNNNISNNMSRTYVSNESQCKHSKLYTKKRYLRQKRKGKNKASPHQKGKAQNHANKQNDINIKEPVKHLQTDSEKHSTHEKYRTSPPLAVIHHEEKEDMLDHDRNEYMKTILKNGNNNISNNMSRSMLVTKTNVSIVSCILKKDDHGKSVKVKMKPLHIRKVTSKQSIKTV
ncbi:uncharacterized protein [Apostichopus japonicus]|uniref:uncharacterized protein isoform X2 n=1 Tax=Stichopus japonicus TaxID=307972 RepID=UPI003AB3514C